MANQHKYSDLDLRFTANPVTGDVSFSFDDQAVIRSVRNLISSRQYDRLWQPEIDPGIDSLLFEPITTLNASFLEDEIARVIKNFEPRASVAKVSVLASPEKNLYTVNLAFYINNSLVPTAINVILQRAR